MTTPTTSTPSTKPSAPATKPRTSEATLLYWLLVLCGLAGLTFQRLDAPFEVAPLWFGTVAGVGLGQLIAWLRVRAWVLAVFAMCVLWLSPFVLFVLYGAIRPPVEACFYAFVPAALCGYGGCLRTVGSEFGFRRLWPGHPRRKARRQMDSHRPQALDHQRRGSRHFHRLRQR